MDLLLVLILLLLLFGGGGGLYWGLGTGWGIGPIGLIVLVIVVVIFGAGRLSDVGGALGKSIREFRKATTDDPSAHAVTAPPPAAPPLPEHRGQSAKFSPRRKPPPRPDMPPLCLAMRVRA